MKKYLLSLLTLTLLLCEASFTGGGMAFAATAISGTDLTWDLTDGTLTINYDGSGSSKALPNYTSTSMPWNGSKGSISKIVIKDNVTSIGNNAFNGCSSATTVEISPTVTSIGTDAFKDCSALTKVVLRKNGAGSGDKTEPKTWAQITFANNTANPLYYAKHFYCMESYMTSVREVKKEQISLGTITSVKNYAFINCTDFTKVTIPNTVITIGDYAFSGCTKLADVTFAETSQVTAIRQYAFYDCTALPSIDLPLSLDTIGYYVFKNCSTFTSITIPRNVRVCGEQAFTGCANLKNVVWNAVNCTKYNASTNFTGSYGPFWSSTIKSQIQSFTFGDEVEVIPPYICYNFTNNNFKKVTIPASVSEISQNAFSGCTKIENVDFSLANNLATIGQSAFYQTTSLKAIDLRGATSLTTIGNSAFSYTSAMPNTKGYLYIPATVTSIGPYAFQNRTNITGIVVLRTESDPISVCANANSFNNVPTTIPVYVDNNELVGIYEEATCWSNFTNITSNKILEWECGATTPSDLVAKLNVWTGELYFEGAGAMKDFDDSSNKAPWRDYQTVITSIDLTNVTTIGNYAFYQITCPLEMPILPDDLTSIGNRAFSGCSGLTGTLTLPQKLLSIGSYAFSSCTELTELDFDYATKLTTIHDNAFYNCNKIASSITLPASLTTMETCAFQTCRSISGLTFADGFKLTALPTNAFQHCNKLAGTITIPASIESIGNFAFQNCSTAVALDLTQATSLSTIGTSSFAGCSGLDGTLIFPSSMTSIGSGAFNNCTGIDGIVILKETTPIITATASTNSFNNMPTTTPVMVATSALKTSYSSAAGWNHFAAASFTVGFTVSGTCGTNLNWSLDLSSGALTFSGAGTVMNDYNDSDNKSPWHAYAGCIKTVTLPATLTHIGDYIFADCGNMTSLTIPNTVTSIGEKAFANCKKIESVTIPADVATIGSSAFYGCTGLTSVTWNAVDCADFTQSTAPFENIKANIESFSFGSSVEHIPAYLCTGMGNASFTSVIIPESVASIGERCFYNCSELSGVYYNGTINQWCIITFSDAYANPLRCAENLYIDNVLVTSASISVSNISAYALEYNKALTSLTLTSTVTIGNSAFESCENLEGEIVFPSSITTIGNSAFASCKKISAISFAPDASLTTLGYSSFNGCLALRSIVIPQNVNYIGYSSFYNPDATNIRTIKAYPSSSPELGTGFAMFYSVVNANATLYIPLSGYDNYMEKTTWSNISHKVLFGDCGSSGDNVQFELDLTTGVLTIFGSGAMEDYALNVFAPWYDYKDDITSVSIEEGITRIGVYAFRDCAAMTSVALPASITEIGDRAFDECTGLATYSYAGTLNDWLNITFEYFSSNPMYHVHRCYVNGDEEITNLVIPNGMTTIKDHAFRNCTGLTSVSLPSSITTLTGALNGCTGLTSYTYAGTLADWLNISVNSSDGNPMKYVHKCFVNGNEEIKDLVIPNGTTSIGQYAFYMCSGLTSVTIPASLTSIGSSAFSSCSNIATVNYLGTISQWCAMNFDSNISNPTQFSHQLSLDGEEQINIYLPDELSAVKDYVFAGNSKLETISVNSSTTIHPHAFDGCSAEILYRGNASGVTADGLSWSLVDGLLTISGEGAMTDYGTAPATPWYVYRSIITGIVIGEGVTSIGTSAFGQEALVSSILIPSTVTAIGDFAFSGCTGVERITCNAVNPPTITDAQVEYSSYASNTFTGIPTNIVVMVPIGSTSAYQNSRATPHNTQTGWARFNNYQEPAITDIDIIDSENNGVTLTTYNGHEMTVHLTRTIISASYNTICLPFAMTAAQVETYFGENCDIEELTKASCADGNLKLFFTKRTAIEAGKPYLIQPQSDVANPTIAGVTIDNTSHPSVFDGGTFTGIFSPTVLANSENLLFVGASNTLYMSSGGTMKGMRGYFELTTPAASAAARRSARIILHEEVATGIEETITNDQSPITNKIIRDGQLFILRDGKTYNAQGALMK